MTRHPDPQSDRYTRQTRARAIGPEGQAKLATSHALIVGVGALGCVSADLLTRAGVGQLTIIDRDLVERTNLHRQPLFTDQDAQHRAPKAIAAKARLSQANPDVTIHAHIADFTPSNAEDIIEHTWDLPHVLIDGTDNFETRYLINDCAVKLGIPYIYGGAIASAGSVAAFLPSDGPCLRCLHPDPPAPGSQPTCETAGVVNAVSSLVASAQAAEALKILTGQTDKVLRSMLHFDLWEGTRTRIDLTNARDPSCVCCAQQRFEFLDTPSREPQALCGRNAVQIAPGSTTTIDLTRLASTMGSATDVQVRDYMVRAPIDHAGQTLELTCFADGRAIIEGTCDPAIARSVYARYIGS